MKIILQIILVLTFLSCNKNKVDKQNFKVYGEESLLKDCKINISIYTQIGYDNTTSKYIDKEKLKTLLFNGKLCEVKSLEDDSIYTIYFSYKDSLVCTMDYENIMKGDENQINHFYLYRNKNIISFRFVGNEKFLSDLPNSYSDILIPANEYFAQKRIHSEDSINKEKKLFFSFYHN